MRAREARAHNESANGGCDPDLQVQALPPLPASLAVGRGTVAFVSGACFHARKRVRAVRILVGNQEVRPDAARMPRIDVFESAPSSPSYRSGFWGFVSLPPGAAGGTAELAVEARLDDGTRARGALARVEVEPGGAGGDDRGGKGEIAICMATFEPEIELFRRQIESIRGQTLDSWTCVISDDCSSEERFAEIGEVLGDDPRFVVSRSPERLGFYRNFERALGLAPPEARYVALCDQDDRWRPEKLEALRASVSSTSGGALLAYSDARIIDADDKVVADTYWSKRRNNHTNLASLLIANTITGAASLFRRELLDYALPFPEVLGTQYHDHWLGAVALSLGEVAYVDRPLYDYVQHGGAALGHAGANVVPTDRRARAAALRGAGITGLRRFVAGWRSSYFYEYCRLSVLARVLMMRCEGRLTRGKRRALQLLVRSERSPLAFAWLALRPLRRLAGRNETLSSERLLARGIVWRWLVELLALGRERPPRIFSPDAAIPALDGGRSR